MSIAEVKDVIQDVFSTAEQDLDADEIIGKLFSARIIDIQKYEAIQEKETTRDKNRVLLQHLYKAADVKMLTRFCDILDDTTRPKHKTLGRCIRTKLQSIQSNSTCVLLHSGSDGEKDEKEEDKRKEYEEEEDEEEEDDDPDFHATNPVLDDTTPWRRPQVNPKGRKLFPRKRACILDSDSEPEDCSEPEVWCVECIKWLQYVLYKEEFANPFMEPVDEADAPGYSRCIKNPMWLKKVEENLRRNVYQTEVDMLDDLQRIVNNSKEFNTCPDSKIYRYTLDLEEFIHETGKDRLYDAVASDGKRLRRK